MRAQQPDYLRLLDADLLAFIDQFEALFPAQVAALPMSEQRAIYNRMCRVFHAGTPATVRCLDEAIAAPHGTIPVRHYRPAEASATLPTVLYFHGGGFVFGDLDSHHDICAEICERTLAHVVSVDYRLAPEHHHPAPLDDARTLYEAICRTQARAPILMGESAGGLLAAGLALHLRQHPTPPAGLLLVYPLLGGDTTQGSYLHHAHAPLLSTQAVLACMAALCGSADVASHPHCWPLGATDFAGLPPTRVFTAQYDPLTSDGEALCARIGAAGGTAHWQQEAGLVHGYLRARNRSWRARAAFERVLEGIRQLGQTPPTRPVNR